MAWFNRWLSPTSVCLMVTSTLRVRSRIAVRRPLDRSAIFRALYVRTHRDPRDGTGACAEWLLPTSCGTAVRTLPQTFPWTGDARGDPGPATHSSGHSP